MSHPNDGADVPSASPAPLSSAEPLDGATTRLDAATERLEPVDRRGTQGGHEQPAAAQPTTAPGVPPQAGYLQPPAPQPGTIGHPGYPPQGYMPSGYAPQPGLAQVPPHAQTPFGQGNPYPHAPQTPFGQGNPYPHAPQTPFGQGNQGYGPTPGYAAQHGYGAATHPHAPQTPFGQGNPYPHAPQTPFGQGNQGYGPAPGYAPHQGYGAATHPHAPQTPFGQEQSAGRGAPVVVQPSAKRFIEPPDGHGRDAVDVGAAFGAGFRPEGGIGSLGVGAVLSIIPIAGPLAMQGWCSEIAQRVHMRHPVPVPRLRFTDFGYWIKRGVPAFVVNMAYGFSLSMAMNLLIIPFYIALFAALAIGGEVAAGAVAVAFLGVAMVSLLAASVFGNALIVRADLSEDFGESFKLSDAWGLTRRRFGTAFWALLLAGLATMALLLGGMLAMFVGMFLVLPVIYVAFTHLRVQIYEIDLKRGGPKIRVRAPEPLPAEQGL